MSLSEQVLWEQLRAKRLGFKFRRQHPIGPYVVDFYCPAAALAVEVDGEQHFETLEQGRIRDEYLRGQGIEVVNVPSFDLFDRSNLLDRWLQVIGDQCRERTR